MAMGNKGGTLRASIATGYRITFPASRLFVQLASTGGTFWVKVYSPGDTLPAAVPTNAAIPGAGLQTDFLEIKDLWTATFGDQDPTGVRRVSGNPGAFSAVDVWCEAAGDLIVSAR